MEKKIVDVLLKYRYWLGFLSLIATVFLVVGAKNIYLDTDYQMFFNEDDPQKLAHEKIQQIYTKTDNLSIMIKPREGDVFTPETLAIIKNITDRAWRAPYSIRVDSITNYQHSWAEGDELIVEDLVSDTDSLDQAQLDRIRGVALNEKQLVNRLIAGDGKTTLINISLELPPRADSHDAREIAANKRMLRGASFREVVAYGNQLRDEIMQAHPDLTVHLLGIAIINQSFNDSAFQDATGIIPLMYLVIIVALVLFLRSLGSVVGTTLVISLATLASLGAAGWIGYALNNMNIIAFVIILAISVCDCVHLLVIYLRHLAAGEKPVQAMRESLLVNLQPIVLTSVTTAVGFATLNFASSPPFRQLGNIAGFGVMFAMLLTLTLLPVISILLVRSRRRFRDQDFAIERFAGFTVRNGRFLFVGALLAAVLLVLQIPKNHIDDDPVKYFQPGVPYRDAADFAKNNLPAIKNIDFSINCGKPGCLNDPEFLTRLEQFGDWMLGQPGVEYVNIYSDVIKRLNRNMHGDDPQYYRIPDGQDLAAQYQLLYELSLPFGLDLNNQVNFDKSATRVSVFTRQVSTGEFVALEQNAQRWFRENYPDLASRGASVHMMFSVMGENNIRSMIRGAVLALLGVTLAIFVALRSFKYTLLSLIPNAFPAAMALGIWGLLVGQVNMSVAVVFSITLGIVVDDTVHFICKYRRARDISGKSAEQAIHYAFSTVGAALLITTLVLSIGFGLLTLSDFNVNRHMGALTTITIVVALVFDFLILPSLLMLIDGKEKSPLSLVEGKA